MVFISICILIAVYIYIKVTGLGSKSSHSIGEIYLQTMEAATPQKKIKKDSAGEICCREFLENKFQTPFPKTRPDFLKNPVTNMHNFEIDCFSEKLKLGVEYNGRQHYEYTPYFHKNHDAFRNQQYRDELKRRLCKDANIRLIEVPYHVADIPAYLNEKLADI